MHKKNAGIVYENAVLILTYHPHLYNHPYAYTGGFLRNKIVTNCKHNIWTLILFICHVTRDIFRNDGDVRATRNIVPRPPFVDYYFQDPRVVPGGARTWDSGWKSIQLYIIIYSFVHRLMLSVKHTPCVQRSKEDNPDVRAPPAKQTQNKYQIFQEQEIGAHKMSHCRFA